MLRLCSLESTDFFLLLNIGSVFARYYLDFLFQNIKP